MSFDFGKSNTKSSNTTTTNGTQTYTPTNLPQLQTGYNAAGQLLNGTDWNGLIKNGAGSIAGAVPGATGLNTTAGNTAANFANGQYVTNGANQYLTPTASGAYVNNNNPNFQNVLNQFSQGAQAATDGNFAASGRYGSGANANAFNGAVANEAGQLGYQNYNDASNRQLTASQILSGNNSTGTAQQLSGAGLAPNLVSSMFTPGTDLSSAGYAPLAAYISAITAGNAGGVGTINQTSNSTGTENVSKLGGTGFQIT